MKTTKTSWICCLKHSQTLYMYGIFTYIYHKSWSNVSKYTPYIERFALNLLPEDRFFWSKEIMAVDSQDPEILATLDRDVPWSCCQHLCVMASQPHPPQKYGLMITACENHCFPLIFGRLLNPQYVRGGVRWGGVGWLAIIVMIWIYPSSRMLAHHHQDYVNPM